MHPPFKRFDYGGSTPSAGSLSASTISYNLHTMGYFETEHPRFPKRDNENWTRYWNRVAEVIARQEDSAYDEQRKALDAKRKQWDAEWPETLKSAIEHCDYLVELAVKAGESPAKFHHMKGQIKNNDRYPDMVLTLCAEEDRLRGMITRSI